MGAYSFKKLFRKVSLRSGDIWAKTWRAGGSRSKAHAVTQAWVIIGLTEGLVL